MRRFLSVGRSKRFFMTSMRVSAARACHEGLIVLRMSVDAVEDGGFGNLIIGLRMSVRREKDAEVGVTEFYIMIDFCSGILFGRMSAERARNSMVGKAIGIHG